jgi:hypothetical protein
MIIISTCFARFDTPYNLKLLRVVTIAKRRSAKNIKIVGGVGGVKTDGRGGNRNGNKDS